MLDLEPTLCMNSFAIVYKQRPQRQNHTKQNLEPSAYINAKTSFFRKKTKQNPTMLSQFGKIYGQLIHFEIKKTPNKKERKVQV